MTNISLNMAEQKLAVYLAKRRYGVNRSAGMKDSRIDSDKNADGWKMDLVGIAGEIAFSRLFNVYPDTDISVTCSSKGQDHGDVTIPFNGINYVVDVKTTIYSRGKLLVVPWKDFKNSGVDLYALMTGVFPSYVFRGFISSKDLFRKENYQTMNGHKCYLANQSKLTIDLKKAIDHV